MTRAPRPVTPSLFFCARSLVFRHEEDAYEIPYFPPARFRVKIHFSLAFAPPVLYNGIITRSECVTSLANERKPRRNRADRSLPTRFSSLRAEAVSLDRRTKKRYNDTDGNGPPHDRPSPGVTESDSSGGKIRDPLRPFGFQTKRNRRQDLRENEIHSAIVIKNL